MPPQPGWLSRLASRAMHIVMPWRKAVNETVASAAQQAQCAARQAASKAEQVKNAAGETYEVG